MPQAPQQFKQLIMVSDLINTFKLLPALEMKMLELTEVLGEFYQLDLEMSFVEQEDVFKVIEDLFKSLFEKFSDKKIKDNQFPK